MDANNWTINETRALFDLCDRAKTDGTSLTAVFKIMAERTGRSVNSVRNYYYSQSKTFELAPEVAQKLGIKPSGVRRDAFVPFEQCEIEGLLRVVLAAKGSGKSVRSAISELAGGDPKLALRYQNKYRSLLRTHRGTVERVMAELDRKGIKRYDPYKRERGADNFARLAEYLSSLDEERVGKFISMIEKLT